MTACYPRDRAWMLCLVAWFAWGMLTSPAACAAEEFPLKIQLIWGTDVAKTGDPKIKELDAPLRAKLAKVIRKKYFFEVDQQKIKVPAQGSTITSMSHECVIEVQHLQDADFKVCLYGKGKLVQTVRQPLRRGHYLTLAGDVANKPDETWIVAISLIDTPPKR